MTCFQSMRYKSNAMQGRQIGFNRRLYKNLVDYQALLPIELGSSLLTRQKQLNQSQPSGHWLLVPKIGPMPTDALYLIFFTSEISRGFSQSQILHYRRQKGSFKSRSFRIAPNGHRISFYGSWPNSIVLQESLLKLLFKICWSCKQVGCFLYY